MMAVQKLQRPPGTRPRETAQRGLAVFALRTVLGGALGVVLGVVLGSALGCVLGTNVALAQSNAPVTGTMGGTGMRAVAAPSSAPAVQPTPVAASVGQPETTTATTATEATAAPAVPVQEAARTPANVVRRTAPPRVGEPARDGMLGDETEALLAVQGNNLAAGRGLPMLGATASRAYKRYLDSFTYPIPAFFETMVQTTNGAGGGGGSGAAGGGTAPAAMGAGVSQ
ncbi:hypothetical protein AB870_25945 [Pandoraea faecigallinarum]|uniref:DUF3613 domain-containing protein n=1 Tax=Pandoraea faecigallinarum TaxID=656179 RepID=A0A173GZY1_9BURK|nr:DUF3613 domain-containing protein [Pandoraea faecigallinarum]ANI21737.1 hypothetical protein AB870_25945 [Pandoraea faecigallinarum]